MVCADSGSGHEAHARAVEQAFVDFRPRAHDERIGFCHIARPYLCSGQIHSAAKPLGLPAHKGYFIVDYKQHTFFRFSFLQN